MSIEADQRVFRPYPPGNVQVNNTSIYLINDEEFAFSQPVISWAHRDRKIQADVLVGHFEGSIGPEPGTTYTIRVLAEDGATLLREVSGIEDATWTYTTEMQADDLPPATAWFELYSVRDGVTSRGSYRFHLVLSVIFYGDDLQYVMDDTTTPPGGGDLHFEMDE